MMIKEHMERHGKQNKKVGYSKMKLMEALNYEKNTHERFELIKTKPKLKS